MRFITIFLLLAADGFTQSPTAQQTPLPQSAQPHASVQPCTPKVPAYNPVHPENSKTLKTGLTRLGDVLKKNTGGVITAPSADDVNKTLKPTPAPCPAPAVQQPAAPPATPHPASSPNDKPSYVCPPKATLLPNTPYCVLPDRTVVDAIPLPPGFPTAGAQPKN